MSCPRCGSANDPAAVTCCSCGTVLARVGALPDGFLIASRYEEKVQRNHRRGRVTESVTRTFAIDLRDGYGVTFSESTDGFRDLIATVGEQTRHIPYLWVPSQGAAGRAVEQAGDYSLIPRHVGS